MTDAFPNFLPALDAATEDALRESIRRFGVLVPVLVDQHGQVLDGHNRTRIAAELGVEFLRRTVEVRDEQHARELVADVNDARRPRLAPEQRRDVVAALREKGHSLRSIAGATGESLGMVQRDLAGVSIDTPAEVTGADGKRYPAVRATVTVTPDEPTVIPGQTAIPTEEPPLTSEEILERFAEDGDEDAERALVKARDGRVTLRFNRALTEVLSTVAAQENLAAAISRASREDAERLADLCDRMAAYINTIGDVAARHARPDLRRVK